MKSNLDGNDELESKGGHKWGRAATLQGIDVSAGHWCVVDILQEKLEFKKL